MTEMTTIPAAELAPFLFGCADLEVGVTGGVIAHRYPAWARVQMQDALFGWAESCAGGTRLRFTTDAAEVRLTAHATIVTDQGGDPASVDLVVTQDGERMLVPLASPTVIRIDADARVIGVRRSDPQTVQIVLSGPGPAEIRMPHNARIELLELHADGALAPAEPAGRRWVHYGSSISQGMNAPAADRTWPAIAASELGWNLRDLSVSGNAQLDGFAARTIRDAAADIITLKVGINLLNADSMRERTFRPALHAFLDTIREGQPDTPIVLFSAVSCPIHEDSPGPVVYAGGLAAAAQRSIESDAGALTLSRTRAIIAEVVAQRADAALTHVDGRALLGPDDVDLLYDRLHPDEVGLERIAARFVELMRQPHS